ncbi:MAG: GGDEF domain-containing protein [Pseudomonadota bacterium]
METTIRYRLLNDFRSLAMLDMTRIELTSRTAEVALSLAREHKLPPTPPVYEVLFTYVTGADPELSGEVEMALRRPEMAREDAMQQIYDDRLGPEALHSGLTNVSNSLTNEIADMSVQISDSLKGNLSLATQMRESIRDLATPMTKDDVRSICKSLASTNKLHLASTQNMALQLERTQFQLSEMQKELSILRKNASVDQLTGLPNRRYLDEKLASILDNGKAITIAVLDIDHFRLVNDRWGYSAGDNILRRIGELLRQNTKGRDIPARIGGEEFAVLLPDTDLNGAEKLCAQISTQFSEINWVSQSTDEDIGTMTLSFGVTAAAPSDTVDTLLDRADMLVYEAKSAGRNTIKVG